jgi:hypothetical protein
MAVQRLAARVGLLCVGLLGASACDGKDEKNRQVSATAGSPANGAGQGAGGTDPQVAGGGAGASAGASAGEAQGGADPAGPGVWDEAVFDQSRFAQ